MNGIIHSPTHCHDQLPVINITVATNRKPFRTKRAFRRRLPVAEKVKLYTIVSEPSPQNHLRTACETSGNECTRSSCWPVAKFQSCNP
jgi:hypothetical protein